VLDAAHGKANHVVSFTEAFTVAAAMTENVIELAGDPRFETVEGSVKVERLKAE